MAKFDVFTAIFESFELIKAHYKEVAVPLILLLLLSGAGHLGGSSLSNSFKSAGSGYSGASSLGRAAASPIANALSAPLAMLSGFLLIIVAAAIVVVALLAILASATWFYVYEHFYAILRKKKITENWQPRMKRQALKSAVILVFWLVLLAALFAIPVIIALGAFSAASSFSSMIGAMVSVIIPFALAMLFLAVLGFLVMPLWVFYAMDNCGFFESLSKSVTLVSTNLGQFIVYFVIVVLLGIGEVMAASVAALCCLAWLVVPLLTVFFTLLTSITLMKMRLALAK